MSEIHPHDWEPTVSALSELVGCERRVVKVSQSLHLAVNQMRPAAVGAMHVTCADESELECVNAFQRSFVHFLLPPVKFAHQAAFRLANLGGRYEWNSVRIAESHFATPESREERAFKVLVVKINSHVGVELNEHGQEFGHFLRYGDRSTCCGALAALLGSRTKIIYQSDLFMDRLVLPASQLPIPASLGLGWLRQLTRWKHQTVHDAASARDAASSVVPIRCRGIPLSTSMSCRQPGAES